MVCINKYVILAFILFYLSHIRIQTLSNGNECSYSYSISSLYLRLVERTQSVITSVKHSSLPSSDTSFDDDFNSTVTNTSYSPVSGSVLMTSVSPSTVSVIFPSESIAASTPKSTPKPTPTSKSTPIPTEHAISHPIVSVKSSVKPSSYNPPSTVTPHSSQQNATHYNPPIIKSPEEEVYYDWGDSISSYSLLSSCLDYKQKCHNAFVRISDPQSHKLFHNAAPGGLGHKYFSLFYAVTYAIVLKRRLYRRIDSMSSC